MHAQPIRTSHWKRCARSRCLMAKPEATVGQESPKCMFSSALSLFVLPLSVPQFLDSRILLLVILIRDLSVSLSFFSNLLQRGSFASLFFLFYTPLTRTKIAKVHVFMSSLSVIFSLSVFHFFFTIWGSFDPLFFPSWQTVTIFQQGVISLRGPFFFMKFLWNFMKNMHFITCLPWKTTI